VAESRRHRRLGAYLGVMAKRTAQRKHLPESPFAPRPAPVIEEYGVDERVTHDKYGLGRVIAAEHAAVVVDFGSTRVRIPSPYTNLSKL